MTHHLKEAMNIRYLPSQGFIRKRLNVDLVTSSQIKVNYYYSVETEPCVFHLY